MDVVVEDITMDHILGIFKITTIMAKDINSTLLMLGTHGSLTIANHPIVMRATNRHLNIEHNTLQANSRGPDRRSPAIDAVRMVT